MPENLKCEKNS